MKVSKLESGKAIGGVRRKKTSSATAFTDELKGAVKSIDPGAVVDTPAVGCVDSMLAVQEAEAAADSTEERSRRHTFQYGNDILDRLEGMRRDLLLGAMAKGDLADLAHTMRVRKRQSDDPRLNAIIDEIELRAEVELAKLTRDV